MTDASQAALSIRLSINVYRFLLLAYPSPDRLEYGPHMAQVFSNQCLSTYRQSGSPGLLWLWALTLFDFFSTVVEEHLQRGTFMSKDKFMRLSNWGFVLGIVAFWLISVFQDQQSASLPLDNSDSIYEWGQLFSGTAGFLLLGIGMLGLYLRYAQQAGVLGRGVAGLGAFSGLSGAAGYVGLMLFKKLPGWSVAFWSITFFSVMAFCLCLSIFGIVAIRRKLLPRWNAIPLISGLCFPLAVLISELYESLTGNLMQDDGLFIAAPLLTALGLLAMAFILQSDPPEEFVESY